MTSPQRAVRRRCSCGCDSTSPSPVDHKPEVETSRGLRDAVLTSPAIEMTPRQVLQVYVLDDRQTGSDVRGHVTGAPVLSRRYTTTPHRPTATSHCSRAERVTTSVDRRQRPERGVEPLNRSFTEHRRSTLTMDCPSNITNNQSLNRHQPDTRTASLDRVMTRSSTDFKKIRSTRCDDDKFQLRSAIGTASLDRRSSCETSRNCGRRRDPSGGVDRDVQRNRDEVYTSRNSKRTTTSDVHGETASRSVGTSWSTARGRTCRRQSDDTANRLGSGVDWRRQTTAGHHEHREPAHQRQREDRVPADDDVDWTDSRWIKRQIHLPIIRQRRLIASEIERLNQRSPDDQESSKLVVNSRTDPDNVCFGQRLQGDDRGELVHRTCTDPTVRVQFTTDDNGNLLKVNFYFIHYLSVSQTALRLSRCLLT